MTPIIELTDDELWGVIDGSGEHHRSHRTTDAAQELVRREAVKVEMAQGCLLEIRDLLSKIPCRCGTHAGRETPPMMYPEWIACCLAESRRQGLERGEAARKEIRETLEVLKGKQGRPDSGAAEGL